MPKKRIREHKKTVLIFWTLSLYGLLTFFLLLPLFSMAQTNERLDVSLTEKIYIQLSSGVYATDQDIWFKAIVVDSENHLPSTTSRVLYVDLIGPNGKVIEHKLTKLTSGLGNGSFELGKNYPVGLYLIRAYTQWNRNFGNDFIFEDYVSIVAPNSQPEKGILHTLTTTELESGKFLLTGEINSIIGVTNQKQIPVYLNYGVGKDTLELKKKDGVYTLDYETPKNVDWITLSIGENPDSYHSETIILRKNSVDVQFFPESGQLVHGLLNKLGVKSLGTDGKGACLKGTVFNDKGQPISDFSTNHLGMGTLTIQVDSARTYYAKVSEPNDSTGTTTHIHPLPKVSPKGSTLSVSRVGEKIWTRISSNHLKGKIYIKVACRGKDYFLLEGPLKNGKLVKDMPSNELPEGILVFTLMDQDKQPIAERLFFNHKDGEALDISIQTDKNVYDRREKTQLNMHILGPPSESKNISLSVLALNKAHFQPESINTIRSYLLLDSEIRGDIEDPDYYFRVQTPERFEALDALLLTQGWRNYQYPIKRRGPTFFWPEKGLEINGAVQVLRNKSNTSEPINVSLATFGRATKFYTTEADSLGRFGFVLDDDYGPKMQYLLSTVDPKGKKVNHNIRLDTISPPEVTYTQKPIIRESDTVVKAVVEAGKERLRTEMVFDSLYGVTQLDEVVVSDHFLTPERAKLYEKYGEPDVIISGDDIRDKEKEWSYGLYSILLFNYGDQIAIERFPDGFMLAHVRGGSREATLLMVDGKLLENHLYEYVPSMSPEIVERVELIKYAKFFKSRYLTVFPQADLFEIPSLGHIISITTKGGVGVQAPIRPEPGTLKAEVSLFTPVKQFYAPKYDKPVPSQEDKPDLRSVIHWQPNIFMDQTQNTSSSFYNGDILGEYIIIVEAISEDGRLGYATKEYSVEEKKGLNEKPDPSN